MITGIDNCQKRAFVSRAWRRSFPFRQGCRSNFVDHFDRSAASNAEDASRNFSAYSWEDQYLSRAGPDLGVRVDFGRSESGTEVSPSLRPTPRQACVVWDVEPRPQATPAHVAGALKRNSRSPAITYADPVSSSAPPEPLSGRPA